MACKFPFCESCWRLWIRMCQYRLVACYEFGKFLRKEEINQELAWIRAECKCVYVFVCVFVCKRGCHCMSAGERVKESMCQAGSKRGYDKERERKGKEGSGWALLSLPPSPSFQSSICRHAGRALIMRSLHRVKTQREGKTATGQHLQASSPV